MEKAAGKFCMSSLPFLEGCGKQEEGGERKRFMKY